MPFLSGDQNLHMLLFTSSCIDLVDLFFFTFHPKKYWVDWNYTAFLQIKKHSMTLVKMYMKRVTMEVESIRNSDRESSQESLLLQGVHFAYRAHQVNFWTKPPYMSLHQYWFSIILTMISYLEMFITNVHHCLKFVDIQYCKRILTIKFS